MHGKCTSVNNSMYPVRFRIDFTFLMLTYNALHGLAPHFLSELLTVYTPSCDLCSSDSGLLVVPPIRLQSMGDWAFSSCAPKLMEFSSF